jgi:2-O-(6-phospho-alpha-D-mannosyl)-D-glycerate hydrolase
VNRRKPRLRRSPYPDPVTPGRDGDAGAPKAVGIVPHTHWDREWYAPFQRYRVQLVHLVDDLLDLLEADPSFTRFLLDGQTAVVDDYLAVRPEAEPRLRALAAAGRLQIGPWMILMDEFMVSGETMIRNLQHGLTRSDEFGGASLDDAAAMRVGYLPDMFGHIAQMPQLLRLAGLEHAVVWRGVPSQVEQTAFWWRAPDGSSVRAEYLFGSYSNGRDIPKDPTQLVARARGYEAELGAAALPGGDMLLMNGSDHLLPQAWLGDVVAAANQLQDDYRFAVTSLAEYVRAQPTDGLATWDGELRSGARANVLMGVASNRVDVHQLAAHAERSLERYAEPLSALLLAPTDYPSALLDVGWRQLVLNSAHDSSCACSADDVVEAVRVRYQEARHVGEALTREAVRTLATTVDVPPSSTIVVNSTSRRRAGIVSVPLPGRGPVHLVAVDDGSACPTQVVHVTTTDEGISTVVVGQKIRWVLEMMRGPELAGARINRVEHHTLTSSSGAGGPNLVEEFTFHDAAPGDTEIDLETVKEQLLALGEAGATISIRQRRAPVRDVLVATSGVPGFGWRSYRAVEGEGPATAVRAEGLALENEHVRAVVDPADGTLSVTCDGITVAGCNRYVDGGDGGDTYNYSPPAVDTVIDRPESVTVAATESGPVRARIVVTSRYVLPAAAVGDERACSARSDERVPLDIVTTYELRTGERFVRVHVELDHRVRDHRLRAHFPLPAPVDGSHAECAFAIVRRGLTAEGGPHEFGLPTFVSRRFVDCSSGDAERDQVGLSLLHDGLLEYEVVADDGRPGTELALTLLRATGYLSRSEPALRPNPAGPLDRLEGPQLQTAVALDYAVLVHGGDVSTNDLPAIADDVLVPLERVRGGGWPGASGPARGSALEVEGAEVSALLRDDSGALVLRMVNRTPNDAQVTVARHGTPLTGFAVDLTGAERARFAGRAELRPWELLTLRLAGI